MEGWGGEGRPFKTRTPRIGNIKPKDLAGQVAPAKNKSLAFKTHRLPTPLTKQENSPENQTRKHFSKETRGMFSFIPTSRRDGPEAGGGGGDQNGSRGGQSPARVPCTDRRSPAGQATKDGLSAPASWPLQVQELAPGAGALSSWPGPTARALW